MVSAMNCSCTTYAYWLPKRGKNGNEYEDAYTCSQTGSICTLPVRYALADGASTSAFAQEWAETLVEDFVTDWEPETQLVERVKALLPDWSQRFSTTTLPWFAQQKARTGSFATLLGLLLNPDGSWQAIAVGDSCLFQVRGSELVAAFPIERSADFNNTPDLLHSNVSAYGSNGPNEKQHTGTWQDGDRFLLMTDALAAWFLHCEEQREKPWETIAERLDPIAEANDRFREWVTELWEQHALHNDDVTLIVVDVKNNDTPISSS